MPKRARNLSPDEKQQVAEAPAEPAENQSAADQPAPAESGKNPAAVALGRLGGKKGGPARAAKLTKEQRSESARKAARARWAKKSDQSEG
jgi:hypothetical protein